MTEQQYFGLLQDVLCKMTQWKDIMHAMVIETCAKEDDVSTTCPYRAYVIRSINTFLAIRYGLMLTCLNLTTRKLIWFENQLQAQLVA